MALAQAASVIAKAGAGMLHLKAGPASSRPTWQLVGRHPPMSSLELHRRVKVRSSPGISRLRGMAATERRRPGAEANNVRRHRTDHALPELIIMAHRAENRDNVRRCEISGGGDCAPPAKIIHRRRA